MTASTYADLKNAGKHQAGRGSELAGKDRQMQAGFGGGSVIGVLGAKGGSGSSTLALNLAVGLSRQNSPAAVIDANLQQPQIATMLQRSPQFGLFDVISRRPDIDLHLLEACAETVSPRCLLLTPPPDLAASLTCNLGELADALADMRSLVRHWVLDLPRHLDRHLVRLIDQCDRIVLVFEPTLVGVAAAKRQLAVLHDLEYDGGKVILAASRCCWKTRQVEKDLTNCFAGFRIVKVANDFDLLQSCLLSAEPAMVVKPGAAYCKSITVLASAIAGTAR